MGALSELLRWKKFTKINLRGQEYTVWLRIIGDWDLQESYKLARVASAKKREALKDVGSDDFRDNVMVFDDASKEECIAIISTARSNQWIGEALSAVVRPDEVKLAEVAIDPDAPTLEEQEKLDAANKEAELEYEKAIQDYQKQKAIELDAELDALDIEGLRLLAKVEVVVVLPLTVFVAELQAQKVWRAVYMDEACTKHAFDSVDDFRDNSRELQTKLIAEYDELEAGADEIKN